MYIYICPPPSDVSIGSTFLPDVEPRISNDFVGALTTSRFSSFCGVGRCLNRAVVVAPTKSLEVLGSTPSGKNVNPIETSDGGGHYMEQSALASQLDLWWKPLTLP